MSSVPLGLINYIQKIIKRNGEFKFYRRVCSFPKSAITNYYQLHSFKQQTFILTVLETTTSKSSCQQSWFPLEALRVSVPRLSLLFWSCWELWHSLTSYMHHFNLCLCSPMAFPPWILSVSVCLKLPTLFSYRDKLIGFKARMISPGDP